MNEVPMRLTVSKQHYHYKRDSPQKKEIFFLSKYYLSNDASDILAKSGFAGILNSDRPSRF